MKNLIIQKIKNKFINILQRHQCHIFLFILSIWFLFSLGFIKAPQLLAANLDTSCECEKLTCPPCYEQTDITFYSAKCGPQLSRVKSCKKPNCTPVENQPECLNKIQGELNSLNASQSIGRVTHIEGPAFVTRGQGATATAAATAASATMAAVTSSTASASSIAPSPTTSPSASPSLSPSTAPLATPLVDSSLIFEGDQIKTGQNGRVRIVFKDKNIFNISPDTEMVIKEHRSNLMSSSSPTAVATAATTTADGAPAAGSKTQNSPSGNKIDTAGQMNTNTSDSGKIDKKVVIHLTYGRIRTKVSTDNKYDNDKNVFQIQTRTAVAGVRGTDFVTEFNTDGKANSKPIVKTSAHETPAASSSDSAPRWRMTVKTFEGEVNLQPSKKDSKSIVVAAAHKAVFEIPAPPPEVQAEVALQAFIDKGSLSNPEKIDANELKALDQESDLLEYKKLTSEEKKSHQAATSKSAAATTAVAAATTATTSSASAAKSASVSTSGSASASASSTSKDSLCHNPSGEFNQCSFSKNSETSSSAGKKGDCIQRRCNANGDWADATVLPQSEGIEKCRAISATLSSVVGKCSDL